MSIIKQLSQNIRRGVLVSLAILIGSLALAAPSHASMTYELQPINLHVQDTEDPWPDAYDEARLVYGGTFWNGTVKSGQDVMGWELPTVRFTGTYLKMELRETDRGYNTTLDTEWITSAPLYEQRTAEFGCGGAGFCYKLDYRVVPV